MQTDYIPNQLDRRLMGVSGLNFADCTVSSPRKQMFSSHIGQSLVIDGGTERFLQTGMEREYAKYTFAVRMPEDGIILKVINRYQETMGIDSIRNKDNPVTIAIYESAETGEIGVLELPKYFSDQTYFGFEYRWTKVAKELQKGQAIGRGTLLLESPAVTDNRDYRFGRETRVAYMSLPGVAEDGLVVCEDILDDFAINTYERRDVEWGNRYIPLNLYGTRDRYKPFPEIGDFVRADGILMALRRDDRDLAIVEQSAAALMRVDYFHDRRIYADGPGGRVVDIRVYHDDYNSSNAPEAFEEQVMKYHTSTQRYNNEIIKEVRRLHDRFGDGLVLSPRLHKMTVDALALTDNRSNGSQERRQLLHRKNPLDNFRVEFVIEYKKRPTIGFKWTDCHGGKGVICQILPREAMPVDENGVSADVVMAGEGTINRSNYGRFYEQYFNATSANVLNKLRAMLNVSAKEPALRTKLEQLEATNPELMNKAWDYLMGFFFIMSPERMHKWFVTGAYKMPRTQYLSNILPGEAIVVYWPPENEREFPDAVRRIRANPDYRPPYGPVTYIGNSGRRIKTVNKVRIGHVYIIMLEKIADDWTGVASGKLQNFGVLSQITSWDKYSSPSRNQAIRSMGESEVRIWVSFPGPRVTADVLDRNNNPKTRRVVLNSILSAERPTDIEQVVDRRKVPYGGARPLQLMKHMGICQGWQLHYQRYDPNLPASPTSSGVEGYRA